MLQTNISPNNHQFNSDHMFGPSSLANRSIAEVLSVSEEAELPILSDDKNQAPNVSAKASAVLSVSLTTPPMRNEYGALIRLPTDLHTHAKSLLMTAIRRKKLVAPFNNMTFHKRHGYLGHCLNYDFYDMTRSAVLVQQRFTQRTKYGTSPFEKNYYIIRRCGRGVIVTDAPKAVVMKLSKASTTFGQVIETIKGRASKPLKVPT